MNIYLFILLISIAAIVLKSLNLLGFPLYLDEGIYISWAHLFSQDPSFAYVSMQDGKTPLFMWLTAYLNNFTHLSIISGRLVSVLAGGITAFAWTCIAFNLFGKKAAIASGIIFLITPYSYFIERMAFVDSLLTSLAGLSFLFLVLVYQRIEKLNKFDWTLILCAVLSGLFLGLSFVTKTSTVAFLITQLIIIGLWIGKFIFQRKFLNASLLLLSSGIFYLVYKELVADLRIGSYRFWENIAEKEHQLTYTNSEIISRVTSLGGINSYFQSFESVATYFLVYLTGIFILFLIGGFLILKKKRGYLWLLVYTVVLFSGTLLAGKVVASRYFYPVVPSMLVIASVGVVELWDRKNKFSRYLVGFLLLIPTIQSIWLLTNPVSFPYASHEQSFVSSGISALGLPESIKIVKDNSLDSVVAINGIWGVSDGAVISFEESGIKAIKLDNMLLSQELNSGKCEEKFKEVDGKCWKINSIALEDIGNKYKYFYITDEFKDIDILFKLGTTETIKEFKRPNSQQKTYLLKLKDL